MKKRMIVLLVCCAFACGCGDSSLSGEKEHFSDEKSENIMNDEKEYSTAQETESTENKESEVIDKFEWEYDEENFFTVGITKELESDQLSITFAGTYDEESLGLMQFDVAFTQALSIASFDDLNEMDLGMFSVVGDKSYAYIVSDGEVVINTIEIDNATEFPEKYREECKLMSEELQNFFAENGLMEEKL